MIAELQECGGCRTCELACSFRFGGDFNYDNSAIKILKKDNECGYFISLINDKCDGCLDYDTPFCVEFCHLRVDLQKIIDMFIQSQKEGK